MAKILIVGGGFSGLNALRKLSALRAQHEIILIDRKATFDFLPALPDILSQRIHPLHLTYPIDEVCKKYGAKFIQDEVVHIYRKNKMVETAARTVSYDYLLLASGAQSCFYDLKSVRRFAYTIDGVAQVCELQKAVEEEQESYDKVVVIGGGYTGIEAATHLWRRFKKKRLQKRVIILEKQKTLLGPMEAWMKRYVARNLDRLGIEVRCDVSVESLAERTVALADGTVFDRALIVWAAGVCTADFFKELEAGLNPQGRVQVNEFLGSGEDCFVAGDAACFYYHEKPLRMTIQFSIMQGELAGENVVRAVRGLALRPFKPLDLGYVVPMANYRACGKALGVNIRGVPASALHYFFCVFRSLGFRNRIGIIWDLLKG